MSTVVLLGTFDTKAEEYLYVRDRIREFGIDTILVDAGVFESDIADIRNDEVAAAAGVDVKELSKADDRGAAVEAMSKGASLIVSELSNRGLLDGILGLGGTGGTSLVTRAMRELPVGIPKVMVSTVASGDTQMYVGAVDITMMYSVVDVAGLNQFSRIILANAAGAISGMVQVTVPETLHEQRPLIGASMFGVTTPAVQHARSLLESRGFDVLVFHATGTGGQSMEELVRNGSLVGVLDLTTTELADELVGGIFSAGPERLRAAGTAGVAQVVSLGALDMVNFGPPDTVPPQFGDRLLYRHNATTTLMRTSVEECQELGKRIAQRLNKAVGPLTVCVPTQGFSMISTEEGPFYDPAADKALIDSLTGHLDNRIDLRLIDTDVNDESFVKEMVDALTSAIEDQNEVRRMQ